MNILRTNVPYIYIYILPKNLKVRVMTRWYLKPTTNSIHLLSVSIRHDISKFLQLLLLFLWPVLRYGLQYLLSYGSKGKTSDLSLHTDCLGNADDPLAKTFDQAHPEGSMAGHHQGNVFLRLGKSPRQNH